jgi:hypothetical protein
VPAPVTSPKALDQSAPSWLHKPGTIVIAALAFCAIAVGVYFVVSGSEGSETAPSVNSGGQSSSEIVATCKRQVETTLKSGGTYGNPEFLDCLRDEGASQDLLDTWSD